MVKASDASRHTKIVRAYVAKSSEREAMAKDAGIALIHVKCGDVVGDNIAEPNWRLRDGELIAVYGLEAFGNDRHSISKAVAWVHSMGAEVIEISTREKAGKGVAMLNRALTKIHGAARFKTPTQAAEQARKSVDARTKGRMPKEQAEPHWRNLRLTTTQALAKMTGWSRPTAYNTFGKRDRTPGRPIKKGEGRIYFVRQNGKGPVKIGYATSVRSRLSGLQTSHRHRLVVVGVVPGTIKDEREFHKRFAEHRLTGEWFACKGELAEFLKTLPEWDGK